MSFRLLPTILFIGLAPNFLHAESDFSLLEDFQGYSVGSVPKTGWRTREGDPKGIYEIKAEGDNKFLEAKDTGQSIQLFKDQKWSLKDFPYLTWRWKVLKFPEGSDERVGSKNDSAAGVYVVFPKRFFVPQAIKYVWSEKVPVDSVIARRKQFPIIVVRTGSKPINEWQDERRNVKEDYEKYFKETAPNPVAFGFLTDANDTKGVSQTNYDNLKAVKAPGGH